MFSIFCCSSSVTCLFFTYNEHLSHHRPLKQRTWTHGCHRHVIAAEPGPEHHQHTEKDQRPEHRRGSLPAAGSLFLRSQCEIIDYFS